MLRLLSKNKLWKYCEKSMCLKGALRGIKRELIGKIRE